MNKITMKIRDDLERKMECCLNGEWTPSQCWHYAYGVERTIRTFIDNNENYVLALCLLWSFMRAMECLMN